MSVTSLDVSSQTGREGKKVNFIQAAVCGTGGSSATVFPASAVGSSSLSSSGGASVPSCLPSSAQDLSRKSCGGQVSKAEEGCSSFLQAVDGEIPRPTSAPPHLEKFSASTLFAFPPSGSTVNRLIDIRCDELYQEFYRHLSQTNPNLPKPLEEDQSFLDLASQKKARCRSSRNRYAEHTRNGTTEGALSCCPALTSSFSCASHSSGITEDEEGTTTESTRRLSTAAAVNAAAALAFVDELQHRHEGSGLMYSNRSALSLGIAPSSCRNSSLVGVSPQSPVVGGGGGGAGPSASPGRFTVVPSASSGGVGYHRGPGRVGSDGRTSFPSVASNCGGVPGTRDRVEAEEGASVSAAAAAALLQDAHAAWKDSGGSAALLPVVQKWKEAILSRCPDASYLQTPTNNGASSSADSIACPVSAGRLGGNDARYCKASNTDLLPSSCGGRAPAAPGQGSVVLVLPTRDDVSSDGSPPSNTSEENTVGNQSRSSSQRSSERRLGTNTVVAGTSSSNTAGALVARGVTGQSVVHGAPNQTSPRGCVDPVGRQPHSAAAAGMFTCEPGRESEQLRAALSAAGHQDQHLLQAFAALGVSQQPPTSGAPGAAHHADADARLLAFTKSTLSEAVSGTHQSAVQTNSAASGGDTTPVVGFHPALSLSGALGTTPAEAAALLSAVAGASAVGGPSSGMVAQGSAGLGLHLGNSNGGLPAAAHHHHHEPGGGGSPTPNSAQALGAFAALGQAFQREMMVGPDDRASAAADVASAAEAAGNAQLLSSVLYPLLNAGLAPVALTPAPSSSPMGMVFGSTERDPRASVPCMIDSAALLSGHPGVYQAGSLTRPQSLGVGGQAFPASAAALFASAAKLPSAPAPPGIPALATGHHVMFTRGGGDPLELRGDLLQQESAAAAHAVTSGSGPGAGLQTWVGLEGASRGQQPMFLGPAPGLDGVRLDGGYLRSHAAQLGVILPHPGADSSTEPSGSGSSHLGSQNTDVASGFSGSCLKGRSGRWSDRGRKQPQGPRDSKSTTRLATSTASAGGRKRDVQGPGRLAGDSGSGVLGGTLSLAAAEELVFGNRYRGKIDVIARDQIGCRMLQRKLSEGDAEETRGICSEVLEHAVSLLVDPFGNYLVQKVIEECEESQLLLLVRRIRQRITDICLSPHGTRAVQKLIEVSAALPPTSQVSAELLAALKSSIVLLAKDVNANHVVQKLLLSFPPSRCDFTFSQVKQQCVEICKERHGCCVMQRCIDAAPPQAKSEILLEITANALELIQDAFGNYVVQYVLDLQEEALNSAVARKLQGHIRELSMQKFASNVVEKFLILGTAEQRNMIVQELLADGEGLRLMLLDSYANYVVQRALTVAPPPLQQQLLQAVQPCLPQLRQTQQGNRVAHKLVKKFPSLVASFTSSGSTTEGLGKEEEKKPKSSGRASTKAGPGSTKGSGAKGEGGRNRLRHRKMEKAEEDEEQQFSVSRTGRGRRKPWYGFRL